jgi:iron complex outermembrane receptor protein
MTKSHLLAAASAAALLASTHMALAQSGGAREILVTATKRATTIQDVPFSLNAQTEQDILRSGSNNLEDLSRNVAGLSIQNLGPGQSQVGIRGVSAGQIIRDQPGVKEQVGIYFDLNRVETLRGPQGTLFGSGSVGGTIRYITNQPNLEEFEGTMEGGLNTLTDGGNGSQVKGMLNFPLKSIKAALRLVGYHTEYGGFIDALREGPGAGFTGTVTQDVNDGERNGFRAALEFHPWENVTLTPRIVYQDVDTNGFNRQEVYNLYANPFTTTRPPVTFCFFPRRASPTRRCFWTLTRRSTSAAWS